MRTVLENLARKTNSTEIESLECAEDTGQGHLDSYVCVDIQTGDSYYRLLGDDEVESVRDKEGLYCFEDDLAHIVVRTGFWYELCHEWDAVFSACGE